MANEGICAHPITPSTIHATRTRSVITRACFCQDNKDKISCLVYLRGDSRVQGDCGCEGVSRGNGTVAQSLSHARALVPPWTGARQAAPSSTVSWISRKFMPIKSAMLSHHLILCRPTALHESQPCCGEGAYEPTSPALQNQPKRTGHGEALSQHRTHWRRKWQPTLVSSPGEPHGKQCMML